MRDRILGALKAVVGFLTPIVLTLGTAVISDGQLTTDEIKAALDAAWQVGVPTGVVVWSIPNLRGRKSGSTSASGSGDLSTNR